MLRIKISFLVLLLFQIQLVFAQDSLKSEWIPKANLGLNISQISFQNWTQGGENSITWTLFGNSSLTYQNPNWIIKNTIKFAYGKTKLGSQEFRTNDNELYIESILSKIIGWTIDPYFSNTIRTPITTGYSYKTSPPEVIANFFDPGYMTQSIGFAYDKIKGTNIRLGIAFQEIFTKKQVKYTDDPNTLNKVETFKLETGIESTITNEFAIMENIFYKGNLRLFSRFENLLIWEIRFDNLIIAKVNKYVNVNFNVLLLYDKKQSFRTQVKEALQIGIIFNVL